MAHGPATSQVWLYKSPSRQTCLCLRIDRKSATEDGQSMEPVWPELWAGKRVERKGRLSDMRVKVMPSADS